MLGGPRIQHLSDRAHELVPARNLVAQTPPPRGRQAIDARALVAFRELPFCVEQALELEPLERRIELSRLSLNRGSGGAADCVSDSVTVQRTEGESAQDEHIKRALQEFEARVQEGL